LFLILLDVAVVTAILPLAFYIRSATELVGPRLWEYRHAYLLMAVLHVLLLGLVGTYKRRFRSYWQVFMRLSCGAALAGCLAVVFLYIFRMRWGSFPTGGLLIAFGATVLGLFGLHALILSWADAVQRRVVLVGSDSQADIFTRGKRIQTLRTERLEDLADYPKFDEVILCDRIHDERTLNLLLHLLQQLKTDVYFAPSLYARLLSDGLNGNGQARFLATFVGRKTDLQESLMRVLDVGGGILLLMVTAPAWPLVALAVRLSGPGPVFYTQDRAGKDGRVFTLYKFRTMRCGTASRSVLTPARENDPRVTRIGRFLRRTRLDELPQVINVLRGEMSLVGPRPENLKRIQQHRVLQGLRLAVRPGLTGLAQIRSLYDVHPRHKIRYDYLYIQRRSVQLNLYILWRTIPVVLAGRGQ
jgi:lipopolysaccharide/colanic/teichoic acid biosynthesis glycosyltransferase